MDLMGKQWGLLSWVVAPLFLGGAVSGCGYSVSSLADDICECEGCSDNRYDEVLDFYEDAEREAENEGCEDQFDDYLSCAGEELECHESEAHFDGCGSEERSFFNCMGSNSFGGRAKDARMRRR